MFETRATAATKRRKHTDTKRDGLILTKRYVLALVHFATLGSCPVKLLVGTNISSIVKRERSIQWVVCGTNVSSDSNGESVGHGPYKKEAHRYGDRHEERTETIATRNQRDVPIREKLAKPDGRVPIN